MNETNNNWKNKYLFSIKYLEKDFLFLRFVKKNVISSD